MKSLKTICVTAVLFIAIYAVISVAAAMNKGEPKPVPKQDMSYLEVINAVLGTAPPDLTPPDDDPVDFPDIDFWYISTGKFDDEPVPEQPDDIGHKYDPPDLAIEKLDIPLLVNEENPLGEDYIPEELAEYRSSGQRLVPEARYFMNLMSYDAEQAGVGRLTLVSGYRTYDHQRRIYDERVRQFSDYGDEAYAMAAMYVMYPGASEHQSGLTADVSNDYTLDTSFVKTPLGAWLRDNAYKYGFIMRYPEDKIEITKVSYEPWHYRYVGRVHAEYIYEHGLCLEEYVELLLGR